MPYLKERQWRILQPIFRGLWQGAREYTRAKRQMSEFLPKFPVYIEPRVALQEAKRQMSEFLQKNFSIPEGTFSGRLGPLPKIPKQRQRDNSIFGDRAKQLMNTQPPSQKKSTPAPEPLSEPPNVKPVTPVANRNTNNLPPAIPISSNEPNNTGMNPSLPIPSFGAYTPLYPKRVLDDYNRLIWQARAKAELYKQTPLQRWKDAVIGSLLGVSVAPPKYMSPTQMDLSLLPHLWKSIRYGDDVNLTDRDKRRMYSQYVLGSLIKRDIAKQKAMADIEKAKYNILQRVLDDQRKQFDRKMKIVRLYNDLTRQYADQIYKYREQLQYKLPENLTPQDKAILSLSPDEIMAKASQMASLQLANLR